MPGIDDYTELLVHCRGADESTTFTDASGNERSISAVATAQVDTAQTDPFGGNDGVLLCDGDSDYLIVSDFDELDLDSADFTFDFWVRFNSTSGNQAFFSRHSGSNYFYCAWESGSHIRFRDYGGSYDSTFSWSPSADTWYHIAIVRSTNSIYCFVDGTQIGSTQTFSGSFITRTDSLDIGTLGGGYLLNGYISEFRFSRGIARWTSGFTPPTTPYDSQALFDETVTLDDSWQALVNPEEASISETATLDDSWNVASLDYTDYISKIIYSDSSLIYVTDTDPAEIAEIDISTPTFPIKTVYEITGYKNAKDIVLNSTNDYFYVACAEGKVVKIEKANLNNQTEIDTSDTDTLKQNDALSAFLRTYIATDDSSGEVIVIDEATIDSINTDIRWSQRITTTISCLINTISGKKVNTDVRWSQDVSSTIKTDIRWLKYDYEDLSQYSIDYSDIQVKINGTDLAPLDDVDLKSIQIIHQVDEKSKAIFILHRKHDNLDYDNQGNSSQITNQNAVEIYINGNLEFNGNISNLATESENETVTVTAYMNEPTDSRQTKSISMSTIDEQLNPYECLVHNPAIDNPSIDDEAVITNSDALYWTGSAWTGNIEDAQTFATFTSAQSYIDSHDTLSEFDSQTVYPTNAEENPEYYKGIAVNLGTEIVQQIQRYRSFISVSSLAEQLMDGDFTPKQNWTYFWFARFSNPITGRTQGSLSYLGTSLRSLSSDVWQITGASYYRQKISDDEETDLGWYYLGSAPYQFIYVKNGRKTTKDKWEDKNDGLYRSKDEGYDYEQYAKDVAQLEYEKLQNINSAILPVTSANVEITLDNYYYNDIKLLTRLNISNTTTSGIFSNSNGFPVSVKSIMINTSNMRVILSCTNQKSLKEIEEIDETYPDANSETYLTEAESVKQNSKFDPNVWGYIV